MSSEKKTSPVAYVFLFLGTAITGSVLSFVYLWINSLKILPIDWLYVLLAVAIGAAMGFVSTKIVKLFKITSLLPAVAMVVLGCLVFTYFKWSLYVATDARNELSDFTGEDVYYTALWFDILRNDFADENGVPYGNIDEIIRDMQEFSAYDYGILENDSFWNYVGITPDELTRFDLRDLQTTAYYELLGYDYDFGTIPRIAANTINEILNSSGYKYIRYSFEHGETPTVVYYTTNPAALVDTIIRINSEGRWTWDDLEVTGGLLWFVWIVEFLIICGYAVIAAPKAIKALNAPPEAFEYPATDYNNPAAASAYVPPVTVNSPVQSSGDSGWGSGGFGGTSEIEIEAAEEFDEHGRPIAQADEYGR
jgi:hypothetical protein